MTVRAKRASFGATVFVEFNEGRMGQAIDVRIQTADAVAQSLGQHRDDAVRRDKRCCRVVGFAIQRGAGLRHRRRHRQCERQDSSRRRGMRSTSMASSKSRASSGSIVTMNLSRKSSRPSCGSAPTVSGICSASSMTSRGNSVGRWYFRMIESMSTPGARARPEHLDDFAFGIDVARFPVLQADDDLIAALRHFGRGGCGGTCT